jgi:dipeptidase D
MNINELQPQSLWKNFQALNAVPRASKKEERVIAFMMKFGQDLGLDTIKDDMGNVIIKKPASVGMEDRKTIVLQSHLDMVHQKNSNVDFDFDIEGIKMVIDKDWVKAEGTTLGADNGIGVATIMAVLESKDIKHPSIEALFTIDEETGMTGALGLKGGLLTGSILLNLDTEDDREITIGCAGGVDITGTGNYLTETAKDDPTSYQLHIKGLSGGHSGMDIHKGLGNANKLMNRILFELNQNFTLHINSLDGGGLRNAIPRESKAVILLNDDMAVAYVTELAELLKVEYETTDPGLEISIVETDSVSKVLNPVFQEKLLRSIYAIPSGIYRMSPDIEGLVQTSNNLARVEVKDGKYSILCLTRSSIDTEKKDLCNVISSAMSFIDAEVTQGGSYPGWTPKPNAPIIKLMSDLYEKKYNEKPHVNACHAGLECGIIGTNYPGMDMVSFGPNIRGAHSPDERVQISSVQKYWDYFLDTLQAIPSHN